jgi:pyruvate dehydrogenase E2 component (dihydrolipoamide acetyltransferase)
MATDVILPALGMAQETGKILQWLKAAGDTVQKGEAIAEIETDKITVELESPASGILSGLRADVGDDVPVGQTIAVILAEGETPNAVASPATSSPALSVTNGSRMDSAPATTSGVSLAAGIVLASPKARRLANEQNKDLSLIAGSGPDGAVLAADVLAVSAPAAASASDVATPAATTTATLPSTMSNAWRVMAERMTQSWTNVPHFFLTREVDTSALVIWREQVQRRATEKITFSDLMIKVVANALERHPRLNSAWRDGTIALNGSINIGLAVATEDSLLVPVIHQANDLSVRAIAQRRLDLVERAKNGKLRPDDMQNGTFTISNLGMYGVDTFQAIINQPQSAILAIGAMVDRVIVVDGQPAVRPVMVLTLSCDHRVVDGARGAQFLATVAELIAEPTGL